MTSNPTGRSRTAATSPGTRRSTPPREEATSGPDFATNSPAAPTVWLWTRKVACITPGAMASRSIARKESTWAPFPRRVRSRISHSPAPIRRRFISWGAGPRGRFRRSRRDILAARSKAAPRKRFATPATEKAHGATDEWPNADPAARRRVGRFGCCGVDAIAERAAGPAPGIVAGLHHRCCAQRQRSPSRRVGDRRDEGSADAVHEDRRYRRSRTLHAAGTAGGHLQRLGARLRPRR